MSALNLETKCDLKGSLEAMYYRNDMFIDILVQYASCVSVWGKSDLPWVCTALLAVFETTLTGSPASQWLLLSNLIMLYDLYHI